MYFHTHVEFQKLGKMIMYRKKILTRLSATRKIKFFVQIINSLSFYISTTRAEFHIKRIFIEFRRHEEIIGKHLSDDHKQNVNYYRRELTQPFVLYSRKHK